MLDLRRDLDALVTELEQLANTASDRAGEAEDRYDLTERDGFRGRATAYRDAARRLVRLLRDVGKAAE